MIGLHQADDTCRALLAGQILWINLLTDSAPALALGVDPPPTDVMRRRPRGPRRPSHRPRHVGRIVYVGLVMAVVTAALDPGSRAAFWVVPATSTKRERWRSPRLVLAQLFNCFNARSERASAFHRLFTNRYLWGAVALARPAGAGCAGVLLNDAFSTTPLSAGDWLVLALASVVLWAVEVKKLR